MTMRNSNLDIHKENKRTLTVKIVLLTVILGFALSCGGGGGSIVAAPTVSLAASPNPDAVGQASTLTWSSHNATSCSASGGWSGSQPTAGTTTITQSAPGTYTYSLTCTGAGGSKSGAVNLVFTSSTITADASNLGSAMNRDQLGANLNLGYTDDSNSTYIPLWSGAGIGLFRWPGGLISDYYHWQSHSYGPCSPYPNPPSATAFDTWMQAIVQPLKADVAVTVNYGTNATCTDAPRSGAQPTAPRPAHKSRRAAVIFWPPTPPAPIDWPENLVYAFSSNAVSLDGDPEC